MYVIVKSSGTYLSYLNIFIRFSTITLCFRSLKEGLEKRSENQDNVVCEKSAEDHRGHHEDWFRTGRRIYPGNLRDGDHLPE